MNTIFSQLSPSALDSYTDTSDKLPTLEQNLTIALPEELTMLLVEVGDAVMFDKGAKFKPDIATGRESPDGLISLDIFYGLKDGFDSIFAWNKRLEDQLPKNLVTIGGALGGDQICLDRTSSRVFYWKHDAPEDETVTQIALTFGDFMARLTPNIDSSEEQSNKKSNVIRSKSRLDF